MADDYEVIDETVEVREDNVFRSNHRRGGNSEMHSIRYPRRPRSNKLSQSLPTRPTQPPSIMEWFDRSVNAELLRHAECPGYNLDLGDTEGTGTAVLDEVPAQDKDILGTLNDINTDMTDAVSSLAKAQALLTFEGAVRAAERAAATAPPDKAEEAAVAGAKGFQAELTAIVKERVPGLKPVEVLGYVGITRPKFRKKPKKN